MHALFFAMVWTDEADKYSLLRDFVSGSSIVVAGIDGVPVIQTFADCISLDNLVAHGLVVAVLTTAMMRVICLDRLFE